MRDLSQVIPILHWSAFSLFGEATIDLVLTDVVMPGMEGITLTAAIRTSGAPFADGPVIGMTAASDIAWECLRGVGMDDVVAKRSRSMALRGAIEKWLG